MTIPGDSPHTDPPAEDETVPDAEPETAVPDEAFLPRPQPQSRPRRWLSLGATPVAVVALVAGFTAWHAGKARPAPVADPSTCHLVNAEEALSGSIDGTCWAVWAAPGAHGAHSAAFQVVIGGPSPTTVLSPVDAERTTPLAVCANGAGAAANGSTIKVAVYRLGPQTTSAWESVRGTKTGLPLFSDGGTLFAVLSTESSPGITVTAADSSGRTLATLASTAVWTVADTATWNC